MADLPQPPLPIPSTGSTDICPLCRGTDHAPFREVDGYRFRHCADCNFVFLSPMPGRLVLESMYNDDRSISAEFYPKAGSRYRRALALALRLLPYARGRELLDLGCGGGFQVGAFRTFGVRADGLDIGAPSIAYARRRFPRAEFYCEDFDLFKNRRKKYGFVFSSEVIEHVTQLTEYMELLRSITEDSAYVYITTPDIGSPRVPDNIIDWDVFRPPRHVQFFGEANLVHVFDKHGFAFVRRYADRKAGLRVLFRKHGDA